MLPLAMADEGTSYEIVKITGRDETRRRLAEMGLVVGEEVTVMNSLAGNLILQVKESRVALDRALCARIMVKV